MIDFIKQYWLQVIFGGIISLLSLFTKYLFNLIQKEIKERDKKAKEESAEQDLIKAGVLSLLHDRIYQICQVYIKNGFITIRDLNNLEYLYDGYKGLGGNGTGEELYKRCKSLQIVSDDYTQNSGLP